jgi:hypothetical protein
MISRSIVHATSALFTLSTILGCSHERCKEAGCTGGAQVTFDRAVTVPYELTVRTSGLALSAHCPLAARDAKPVGPNAAILFCDGNGFMVATANAVNGGATQVGSNPVDATTLRFDVGLVLAGVAPIQLNTNVELKHVERPNGPNCPSVCYGRQGTLNLAP